MTLFIIIFGILILLAGAVIVVNPELVFRHLRNNIEHPVLHILAVAVRFILGVCLVSQAGVSKFPLVIEILGGLSIFAALVLTVMGRRNFQRLISWVLTFVKPYGRIGGSIAAAIGGFLVYAFV